MAENADIRRLERGRALSAPIQSMVEVGTRTRGICCHEGCTNTSQRGGVCVRHGPERPRCRAEGCANQAVSGGLCFRHRPKRPRCRAEGCTNQAQCGGLCIRHGAVLPRCRAEGCTNRARYGGLCHRHGGVSRCRAEGCTNYARQGGVCIRHGAGGLRCRADGCTSRAKRGGLCIRHGAKVTPLKCSVEGCTNHARRGGLCYRHRNVSRCSAEGCTKQAGRGGVCVRHGANNVKMSPQRGKRKGDERADPELENGETAPKKSRGRGPALREQEAGAASAHTLGGEGRPAAKGGVQPHRAAAAAGGAKCHVLESDAGGGSEADDVCDNEDDRTSHEKNKGVDPPSDDVLQWVRSMSSDEQRGCVRRGMRAKVRFDDGVWYGGSIASVLSRGLRIKIGYDDGTEEVSNFPDSDVVIDDRNNGSHLTDAEAFVPLRARTSSGGPETDGIGRGCDSDEEEELGALIYRLARPVVERCGDDR